VGDFIRLDTGLAIMTTPHKGLSDTKYRPCLLLEKYLEAGRLDRKSGHGFYDYCDDSPVPTRSQKEIM
jgi:3-hydroxybutyryl-CoA dehydrogenase